MAIRDNIVGTNSGSSDGTDIVNIDNIVRKTIANNCTINSGDFVRYMTEDTNISALSFSGLYSLEYDNPSIDQYKDNTVLGTMEYADTYRRILYVTNSGRELGTDIIYDIKLILLNYKYSTNSVTVVGSKNIVVGSTKKIRFSQVVNVDTNKCLLAASYTTSTTASMNLYTIGVSGSTPVYAEKKQVISNKSEYNYPSFIHKINEGVYIAYYAGDNACTLVVPAGSESIPKIDTYGSKSSFFSFLGTNKRIVNLRYNYIDSDSFMVVYNTHNPDDITNYNPNEAYDIEVSYNKINSYTSVDSMTSASQISLIESTHDQVLTDIQGIKSIDIRYTDSTTALLAYQYPNSTTTLVSAYIKYNTNTNELELLKGSTVYSNLEYSIKDIKIIIARNKIVYITLANDVRYIIQYEDHDYPTLKYLNSSIYKTNDSNTLMDIVDSVEYTTDDNTFLLFGVNNNKIGYNVIRYNYTTEPTVTSYIDKTYYSKKVADAGIEEVSYSVDDNRLYMELPDNSSLPYTTSLNGIAKSIYENISRYKAPKVHFESLDNIHVLSITGGDTGTSISLSYKKLSYTSSNTINTKFTHNSVRLLNSASDAESVEYDISSNSSGNPIIVLHTPDNTEEIHVVVSTSTIDSITLVEKNTKKDVNYIIPFGTMNKAIIIGDKTITLIYYNTNKELSYSQISAPGNIIYATKLSTEGCFAILYIDSNNNTIFKIYRVSLTATTLESGLLEGVPVTITGYSKAGLIIPLDSNYNTSNNIAILTSTSSDSLTKANMRIMTMNKLNADTITVERETNIYLSNKNTYHWIDSNSIQILADNPQSTTIDSNTKYNGNVLYIFDSSTIVSGESEYYSSGLSSIATNYSTVSLLSFKDNTLFSTASITNGNNVDYALFIANIVKEKRRVDSSIASITTSKIVIHESDEYENITDSPIGIALESGIMGDNIEIAINQ